MLNAIIVAGATVLLMGQAYAEEYQSLVPDWTHTHKMQQDTEPSFFAYLDRLGESAISDRRKERIERYDQSWVDKRYWCEKKVTLNGRRNSVVFQELPTGKNFFAVTCGSGCENLKISVATNRNIVIGYSGRQYDFPHFWVPGPTTYLWDINVGFIVFDDGEDSSPDLVHKRTGRPSLSDETEVTINTGVHTGCQVLWVKIAIKRAPIRLRPVGSNYELSLGVDGIIGVGDLGARA